MTAALPIIRKWGDIAPFPISVEGIRRFHSPASAFRISPMTYLPGTAFCGLMSKAGRVYVVQGRCRFACGAPSASAAACIPNGVELCEGEWFDIPAGYFSFEAMPDADVTLVNVWDPSAMLQEHFRVIEGEGM
jgi:hypothetical protein